MNGPQETSPRRRLQTLLSTPDGERTEAQWEELNELEIELASGNRQQSAERVAPRNSAVAVTSPNSSARPGIRKPQKKFHRRPR